MIINLLCSSVHVNEIEFVGIYSNFVGKIDLSNLEFKLEMDIKERLESEL
jgi:hypothetical protein